MSDWMGLSCSQWPLEQSDREESSVYVCVCVRVCVCAFVWECVLSFCLCHLCKLRHGCETTDKLLMKSPKNRISLSALLFLPPSIPSISLSFSLICLSLSPSIHSIHLSLSLSAV